MAHMMQLPFDILNVILLLVAPSPDGATDLARSAAACEILKNLSREPAILRVVNFQRLTFIAKDYRMHHHIKDLLCMCARAGNRAARSILGKALLVRDPWFWSMIFRDNQLAYSGRITASEALHHHSLVRTFILNATSQDIAAMRQQLVNYVITYAGYNMACDYGLIDAICDMCSYEVERLRVNRRSKYVTFGSFESVLLRSERPYDASYRDTVIMLFDELFPSARD
ncbi:hypothetical protein L1887_22330 [Cichorium endivia]|nr:hypothetical protein L1887_22330 [Cichorium endivia]